MNNGEEKKATGAGAAKPMSPEQKKKIMMICAAGAGAAVLVLIVLWLMARTPGFAIGKVETAKLTPAECAMYVAAPKLKRNLRYLSEKEPVKALSEKKVPQEFQRMTYGPELDRISRKLGVKITPARVLDMTGREVSMARFVKKDKADPSDFLLITKLGFRQRIAVNLGAKKLPVVGKFEKYTIRTYGSAKRKLFISMGGGYMLLSDSEKVIRDALALGAGKVKTSVAADDTYVRARKLAPKDEKILFEWFSPGGNIKSALTNAKLNYGQVNIGGGGATVFFASKAHSTETKAALSGDSGNPAFLIPNSASLFVTTRSFGRLWQDMLLGKAMTSDEADTFTRQLYDMGLDKFGAIFEGNVVTALDGIVKLNDNTPIPNLVFVYKAKDDKIAFKAADVVLHKTLKETYNRTPGKYLQVPYETFAPQNTDSLLAPSFAVVRGYLVFTLTLNELKKVIRASTAGSASIASQKFFKDYYSDGAAKMDALMLINGERLAADSREFFTDFALISSRPLAEAINGVVVPTTSLLESAKAGIGEINYKDGMLVGNIRFQRKPEESAKK